MPSVDYPSHENTRFLSDIPLYTMHPPRPLLPLAFVVIDFADLLKIILLWTDDIHCGPVSDEGRAHHEPNALEKQSTLYSAQKRQTSTYRPPACDHGDDPLQIEKVAGSETCQYFVCHTSYLEPNTRWLKLKEYLEISSVRQVRLNKVRDE